jgi:hypothetical protein
MVAQADVFEHPNRGNLVITAGQFTKIFQFHCNAIGELGLRNPSLGEIELSLREDAMSRGVRWASLGVWPSALAHMGSRENGHDRFRPRAG